MSFQSAVAGLPVSVKDLVLKATQDGGPLLGENEADQATVNGWIEKAAKGEVGSVDKLKDLNEILTPKTYIATNYLTAADVALYGVLHPSLANLKAPGELFTNPSVTRYFDHVQSQPAIRSSAEALHQFPLVPIDLEGAPKPERKVEEPKKKKEKTAKQGGTDAGAAAEAKGKAKEEVAAAEPAVEKQQKKEKKEKVKKEGQEESSGSKKQKQKAPAPAAPDDGPPVPSMIDLRVGHIVEVMKHPDADGLYVEQVDVGEETPRTVVSGLVNYIPIEGMQNKYIVVVCNLKPANMRGIKSHAMVLCATSKDGKEAGIELVQPPEGAKPGDRIYFEGEQFENATPLPQLNPKKKIFEAIQPGFITLDSKEAAWVNPETKTVHKIRTKDGVCVSPTLVGASLS